MTKTNNHSEIQQQPIPEKRYFTISEASELCEVKPHVLRYWEQEFSVLKPNKRRGSRRYYQRKDIELIRQIRELLYDRGFTIQGARQQLKTGAIHLENTRTIIKPNVTEKLEAVVQQRDAIVPVPIKSPAIQHWLPKILQELEFVLEELRN